MSNDDLKPRIPAIITVRTCEPPPQNDPLDGASQEFRDRIRRQREAQQEWDDDPANSDEAEFWLEVPFRKHI